MLGKEIFSNKVYNEIKDDFEAIGTLLVDRNMYYTAAHPKGLWLSGMLANNDIVTIGLVPWNNISRMVIDPKKDIVYIEVHDIEPIVQNADFAFRKIHKRNFTHCMSDTGKTAISLSKEEFSGSLLAYIQNRIPTEIREERITSREKGLEVLYTIIAVVLIALIIFSYL